MKRWLLVVLIVLMLASPVFAQSQTYFHEVTIKLDGEWDLDTSFEVQGSEASPSFRSGVTLVGVGKAMIHALTKAQSTPSWWDLF